MKTQVIQQKTRLTPLQKRTARESWVINLCNGCGLLMFACLFIFFIDMKVAGWHQILTLRFFNFIFIAGAVLLAFFLYRKKYDYRGIRYLTGIKMGIHITLLGSLLFALFMGIYLSVDTHFMGHVQRFAEFGEYLTPVRAAGGIFIESFATGAILTFSFMQLFKDEEFNPNEEN